VNDTTPTLLQALGICLEEYEYPYAVEFLPIASDLQPLKMAYMDIPPDKEPNGKTVVLFHGKAFGCYYFRNVIEALPSTAELAGLSSMTTMTWSSSTPEIRAPADANSSASLVVDSGGCPAAPSRR
jgi:hypothetical protein